MANRNRNDNRCFLCTNTMPDVVEEFANGSFNKTTNKTNNPSQDTSVFKSCPACQTPLSEMDAIIKDTNLNHNVGEMCLDDCSNCTDKQCDMYKYVKEREEREQQTGPE